MKSLILSLYVLIAIQAVGQTTKSKTITIEPHLSFQNYEHFKRLTLDSPDSPIDYLSGFDYAWGYTYVVKVKETKLREPLSDGTQYTYVFDKIISKTKVPEGAQFKLTIDPNRYYYELDSSEQEMNATLKPLNDSTYLYMEKVEIEVPEALRSQFATLIQTSTAKRGTFVYIDDKRIRLIAFE